MSESATTLPRLRETADNRTAIDIRLADALGAWVKREAELYWSGSVVEFQPGHHKSDMFSVIRHETGWPEHRGDHVRFDNAEAAARIMLSSIVSFIKIHGERDKHALVWRHDPEISRCDDYDMSWGVYSRLGFTQHEGTI